VKYLRYAHHNELVWVREDLKGKHRQMCLCFSCTKFNPGTAENCPMAQLLFEHCKQFKQVAPVLECPDFQEIGKSDTQRLV
jgi:hypothetical protein